MTNDDLQAWMESGEYLPKFMRDFHDQKQVFKVMDTVLERHKANPNTHTERISWVAAHIYTVDVFLWAMARHGYTLQRSRKDLPFLDMQEWLEEDRKWRTGTLMEILAGTKEEK